VVIREDRATHYPSSIVIPDSVMADERSRLWHRGRVLGMGPPARANGHGAEVPPGFQVGDEVLFHYTHHQRAWTRPWPPDGEDATWMTQAEIHAVVEVDT
jgi:co-chaperonin GroES (HSP10)